MKGQVQIFSNLSTIFTCHIHVERVIGGFLCKWVPLFWLLHVGLGLVLCPDNRTVQTVECLGTCMVTTDAAWPHGRNRHRFGSSWQLLLHCPTCANAIHCAKASACSIIQLVQ